MAKLTPRQYATILYEVTTGTSGNTQEHAIAQFVQLLKKRQTISLVPRIIEAFTAVVKAKAGILPLTIISARSMSETELIKITQHFAAEPEVTKRVDETLLGGVVVQVGSTILDASVKTQLQQLQQNLVSQS